MKHTLLLLFLAFFSNFSFGQEEVGSEVEEEEVENILVQERRIGAFDKVKASKGVNVTLIEGEKEKVEIHIKNGDLDDVITDLSKRKLTVKMKTKIYKNMAVQVYVTYKTLRSIETSSGASIDADNTIYADKLDLSSGSDSNMEIDVDVNAIEASVSSARMELSGVCKSQVISASTGGKYYAFPLESNEVEAKASVGGQVQVRVKESIIANAGSGANINYKGEPNNKEIKESMGGKVEAE